MTDDASDNHLDVAQLEVLRYEAASKTWTSTRAFTSTGSLKRLGPLQTFLPGRSVYFEKYDVQNVGASDRSRKLAYARPELEPAKDPVSRYLRHDSQETDPFRYVSEELFAIGAVPHAPADSTLANGQSTTRSVPVLAMPTGHSLDSLMLIELKQHKNNWKQSSYGPLSMVLTKDSARTDWHSAQGSIRQVVFNHSKDNNEVWLAVLTSTSITILRPKFSGGQLSLNHILDLTVMSTFCFECTHIAFHPSFPNSLASIGSRGEFRIWDIQQCIDSHSYVPQQAGCSMYFPWDQKIKDPYLRDTGWRRIMWVLNDHLVLLCSSVNLECWDVSNLTPLGIWSNNGANFPSRILDVKACRYRPSDIVVLTTNRVILLQLRLHNDHVTFEPLVSWLHDRGVDDFGLRFSLIEHYPNLNLVIFTPKNGLVTSFPFKVLPNNNIIRRDATSLLWHESAILNVIPIPLSTYKDIDHASIPHPTKQAAFWQIFLLTRDFSLRQCLSYIGVDYAQESELEQSALSIPASSSLALSILNQEVAEAASDKDSAEDSESGIDGPIQISSTAQTTSLGLSEALIKATFNVPRQMVFLEITLPVPLAHKDHSNTWDGLIAKIASPKGPKLSQMATLASFVPNTVLVDDEEGMTASAWMYMERLNEVTSEDGAAWKISPLALTAPLGLSEAGLADYRTSNIDAIYRQLLWMYNRSLPSTVRGTQRLRKESLTRQVATRLFLSSLEARLITSAEEIAESQQMPSSMHVELPDSTEGPELSGSEAFNRSVARLSKLTKISSVPFSEEIDEEQGEEGIGQILGHWDLQIEPSMYSYEASNAMLTGSSTIEGSAMSAAARDKAARKELKAREKLANRQARAEAAKQRTEPDEEEEVSAKRSKLLSGTFPARPVDTSHSETRPLSAQPFTPQVKEHGAPVVIEPRQTVSAGITNDQAQGQLEERSGNQPEPAAPRPKISTGKKLAVRGKRPAKKPGF